MRAAVAGPAMRAFADSLRVDSGTTRDGVISDLAIHYSMDADEVVRRCINWESWSSDEWTRGSRATVDEITEFYRTTASWSFDLLWFAYLQAELYTYPVSAAIAHVLEGEFASHGRRPRHLDFGGGVGVTSQTFHRSGYESEIADIATGMLEFAAFRFSRRGDAITTLDLNDVELQPGRYDVITAIDTLVHIPNIRSVVRDLHGALAPGGYLFANVAARPQTVENSQFLYDDELPVRRVIQRAGFEPVRSLDGMITQYRRVDASGPLHAMRGVRDAVLLSRARPLARSVRDRLRGRSG